MKTNESSKPASNEEESKAQMKANPSRYGAINAKSARFKKSIAKDMAAMRPQMKARLESKKNMLTGLRKESDKDKDTTMYSKPIYSTKVVSD